ncbi:MAG: hypothetical protein J6O51_03105 [Bacteroidales bacterium]|nr:hypothetical protein [Bacteroidales bacterium]
MKKELYSSPLVKLISIGTESGILINSNGVQSTRNGYGEAIEQEWN